MTTTAAAAMPTFVASSCVCDAFDRAWEAMRAAAKKRRAAKASAAPAVPVAEGRVVAGDALRRVRTGHGERAVAESETR